MFINRFLRRILGIRWSDGMRNEDLWKATKQESAKILLKNMHMDRCLVRINKWMDRSYVKKTQQCYHTKSPLMEPTRTKEKRKAQEYMEKRSQSINQSNTTISNAP